MTPLGAFVVLSWSLTWLLFLYPRHSPAPTHKSALFSATMVAVFAAVTIFYAILFREAPTSSPFLLIVGGTLLLCGEALVVLSRRALKLSNKDMLFRIAREHTRSGPYRYFRHPMYGGLITALLGSVLLFGSILAFEFLVLIVLPLTLWRARIESSHSA